MEFLAQLHTTVIHYPIALLSIYPILMVIYLFYKNEHLAKGSLIILAVGVIGAFFALLTGNGAFQHFAELNKQSPQFQSLSDLISVHQSFATWTIMIFSVILILHFTYLVRTYMKKSEPPKFFTNIPKIIVILALVGLFLLYQTGSHGGKLVYQYGVGTVNFK
ncbi:MAG: DUF2231 domain-containing protein [Ignavibacteriales bacterium]|nr:MAG: DUF2231 domain-containing protein [Ignavibacteriaceae bacterium]MBW7873850.1 DUF2231 domain-containing protein [Ignavibacteria bacterium]MCZ2144187.1 DUF2231 domain-containing protein [Ignavibacteriales bacterium]MBV6445826.1 hypothetical protein [Ignavibacteriaceae bacterium]MBZ0198035.1 DUF2231 domain-containing protein [Ignavibacteriaceae bacterium]